MKCESVNVLSKTCLFVLSLSVQQVEEPAKTQDDKDDMEVRK